MASTENQWDVLVSHFAPEEPDKVQWSAVDNILLAQPAVLDFLANYIDDPSGKRLLEFGCGGGQFAARLTDIGYKVDGVDSSSEMIKAAQTQYGPDITFTVGSLESLPKEPVYDVVSSIMTLQFIPDVHETIKRLAAAVNPGGLLIFAVHNQAFVSDWVKAKDLYDDFDSAEKPTMGTLSFGVRCCYTDLFTYGYRIQ